MRINVQLIDAGTDAHLWAESYDRELTAANIFAIQSEVAAAIAGALKATLTPAEQARVDAIPTQNLEAWEAYQLGKQRMAQRTSAALAEAERLFRKAIDARPEVRARLRGTGGHVEAADLHTAACPWSARLAMRRRRSHGRWSWIRILPRHGPQRAGSRWTELKHERAESDFCAGRSSSTRTMRRRTTG